MPAEKPDFPTIAPLEPDNIPSLLKTINRWIVWRAGPLKSNGKFDKIPVDPATGKNVNGLASANWLSFDTALAAHRSGKGDGIGIALSAAHPVEFGGGHLYLVALDFDKCSPAMAELKELWLRLGKA